MTVTLDIMEDEYASRPVRKTGNRPLNPQPVNGSQELRTPIHNRRGVYEAILVETDTVENPGRDPFVVLPSPGMSD